MWETAFYLCLSKCCVNKFMSQQLSLNPNCCINTILSALPPTFLPIKHKFLSSTFFSYWVFCYKQNKWRDHRNLEFPLQKKKKITNNCLQNFYLSNKPNFHNQERIGYDTFPFLSIDSNVNCLRTEIFA